MPKMFYRYHNHSFNPYLVGYNTKVPLLTGIQHAFLQIWNPKTAHPQNTPRAIPPNYERNLGL